MRELLIQYYKNIQKFLLLGNDEEYDQELDSNVQRLEKEFHNEIDKRPTTAEYEFEGVDAVEGLFEKFERFYGERAFFVNRDPESRLAIKMDLGVGYYKPPCPYQENDVPEIQRTITNYISQRVKTAEDEVSKPLLSGIPKTKLPQEQVSYIFNSLAGLCHSITDYVAYYDDGNWNWEIDCKFIVQYVFEKAAELTYYVINEKSIDDLSYDIKEAFSYFQIDVPDTFQESIDGETNKLGDITIDIVSFIKKNDFNLCDKEAWFRPFISNIATCGMMYTLEHN